MADGRRVPIEQVRPGDEVRSLVLPGLRTDDAIPTQYEWLSTWGLDGASPRPARVSQVRLGEHDGFVVLNGRIKATAEHPFLVRRGDEWGFVSAELVQVGDALVRADLSEEPVASTERIEGRVGTVAIMVPGTNTYLADGVWTHNDTLISNSGSSSGSSSGSASSKSSGSSFSSSSTGSGPGFSNQSSQSFVFTTGSSSSASSGGGGTFGATQSGGGGK